MSKGTDPEDASKKKKKGEKMDSRAEPASPQRTGPQMDSKIQTEIGKHLRAHYDALVNEPVPDRFMELLEKLEQSKKQAE